MRFTKLVQNDLLLPNHKLINKLITKYMLKKGNYWKNSLSKYAISVYIDESSGKHLYSKLKKDSYLGLHSFFDLKPDSVNSSEPNFYYPINICDKYGFVQFESRERIFIPRPSRKTRYFSVEFVSRKSDSRYNYIRYNDSIFVYDNSKDHYSDEQVCLLIKEFIYKQDKKFASIKKQIEVYESRILENNGMRQRELISEAVRFEVWRRDEGKCSLCGSKENLEFDHIIPFSKGGSSTARNLQILCQECNRKKSGQI